MESVATEQSTNVIVIFQGINADSTGIARIWKLLSRHSSLDVVIVFIVCGRGLL
jgi:hypothetical protein